MINNNVKFEERDLTRLSFMTSYMACAPRLSLQFFDRIIKATPPTPFELAVEVMREEILLFSSEGREIDREVLATIGKKLVGCEGDNLRQTTGRLLSAAVWVYSQDRYWQWNRE